MLIYTEDDTESHSNTQNINIQLKTHQTRKNTFHFLSKNQKSNIHIFQKGEMLCGWLLHYLYSMLRATLPNQFLYIHTVLPCKNHFSEEILSPSANAVIYVPFQGHEPFPSSFGMSAKSYSPSNFFALETIVFLH